MGLNAYYAVGKGSINPPRLIYMKYLGQNPKKKIALIGKGLTFDSGGMDEKNVRRGLRAPRRLAGSPDFQLGLVQKSGRKGGLSIPDL